MLTVVVLFLFLQLHALHIISLFVTELQETRDEFFSKLDDLKEKILGRSDD